MKDFSVNSIETFGLVDGPGIRTLIFFNGCLLRCKFCHNPEMFTKKENNYSINNLYKLILNNKDYYADNGGVTFSGGEPLLWSKPLIKLCKKLKKSHIHILLDTAGVGFFYEELLDYIDLVILDIKDYRENGYKKLTGHDIDDFYKFLDVCQKKNKPLWIRQVIVPSLNDNTNYILGLKDFISNIKNVKKVELLPYHTMALDKYKSLGIKYPLEGILYMDKDKCKKLEELLKK